MVRDKVRAKQSKKPSKSATAPSGAHATSEELLAAILASLEDDKAVEPVTIELAQKSSIADYMVVVSGTSQRHIAAMAEHAQERLKKAGYVTRSEGLPRCDWVLIDAGDVIVHLFRPEVRDFYNLEKMWSADFLTDASSGGQADAAGGGLAT